MLMTTEGERIQPRPRKNAQIVTDVEDLHFENVCDITEWGTEVLGRGSWKGKQTDGILQQERKRGDFFFCSRFFVDLV